MEPETKGILILCGTIVVVVVLLLGSMVGLAYVTKDKPNCQCPHPTCCERP